MSTGTIENLVIDGERVPAAEGRTFETVDPATGEVFHTVAEAGVKDADRAVRPAAHAIEDWGARTPIQRGKVLHRVNSNSSVFPQAPFGGYKQSGVGKELGMEGLLHNTELKSVFVSTEP